MVVALKSFLWCGFRRLLFGGASDTDLLVLRHQNSLLQRQGRTPPRLNRWDRLLFAASYRAYPSVLESMVIVKPDTLVRWHRAGFRLFWRVKCRCGVGRPRIPLEVRDLIREISQANSLWGAPRIHGELLKLGIEVSQSTVAKYMIKRRGPPSQSWRTFLCNHADGIAAIDLFLVSTIGFKLLFGLVILDHGRRRIIYVSATYHPTAEWIARQIVEAFPWETAPRYLSQDRDGTYGKLYRDRLTSMGIRDRPVAPRSPWQNGYVERVIGSIRRDLLDHVIVLNETHLRNLLRRYADYYNGYRTHLGLGKDAPLGREIQRCGRLFAMPQLNGLHHVYLRT
jgi:transposase InsO family protein